MSGKQQRKRETFACPNCGEDVVVGAKACRACGSDADTGWKDDAEVDYERVDLPDGYRRDGGGSDLPAIRTPRWIVAVALALALLLSALALGALAWF